MTDKQLQIGEKLAEGKTKIVYDLPEEAGNVLMLSKDRITAGDGARANEMEGKARMSTHTSACVFQLLNKCGMRTHYVRRVDERSFVARRCAMIPVEWVARRIATGSYLKRYPGVKEGYRFAPLCVETFLKDDAAHDPFYSKEQLVAAEITAGGRLLDAPTIDLLMRWTATIFEVLEKAWAAQGCTLVDMKVEYGVAVKEGKPGEILLADLIDNDSWRLWVGGDKSRMVDKQLYRDLATEQLTKEALRGVAAKYDWVAQRAELLLRPDADTFSIADSVPQGALAKASVPRGRVVVFLGSAIDRPVFEQIAAPLRFWGVPVHCRVASAHKTTEHTLQILAEYESDHVRTVFVAVAGRSNGLGPVLAGNTCSPVINCPPLAGSVWDAQDVWSSMRLPSGLGCSTVLSPDAAALAAAQILALEDHVLWGTLRVAILERALTISRDDADLSSINEAKQAPVK